MFASDGFFTSVCYRFLGLCPVQSAAHLPPSLSPSEPDPQSPADQQEQRGRGVTAETHQGPL